MSTDPMTAFREAGWDFRYNGGCDVFVDVPGACLVKIAELHPFRKLTREVLGAFIADFLNGKVEFKPDNVKLVAILEAIVHDATGSEPDAIKRVWPIRAENYRRAKACLMDVEARPIVVAH